MRTIDLVPGVTVRLVEGELRRDLGQYLDVMSVARSQDVRRLSMAARGTGDRDLFVSYVSEVPVWKTTYRLVIPTESGRKPFLQLGCRRKQARQDWTRRPSRSPGGPQSVQPAAV